MIWYMTAGPYNGKKFTQWAVILTRLLMDSMNELEFMFVSYVTKLL